MMVQTLHFGVTVNELVGEEIERSKPLFTLKYLANQHTLKKDLCQSIMEMIKWGRDLGVVYRKIPKGFGLKYSCNAESKSDARLYC